MKQEPLNLVAQEQRLDKWLWHARFYKSRNLASKAIEEGTIRVNRVRVQKPSYCIKCGDVLTVRLHTQVRVVEIMSISQRRGPASEAQLLFIDLNSNSAEKGEID